MSGARRGVRERCPGSAGAGRRKHLAADLHPFERGVLVVARGFFQSFAHPESQGWMGAFSAAGAVFPPAVAPHAALAVLDVLQALRRARRSTFRFSNPGCPCCAAGLTEHERALMATLRAVREDRLEAAHGHALLLLEGQDPVLLLRAMAVLVRVAGRADESVPVPHGAWVPRPEVRPSRGRRPGACRT